MNISINKFEFGRSVLSRPLEAVSIGEPRGGVLYLGAFHGCEYITALLLKRFANKLNSLIPKDTRLRKTLAERGVTIAPCVNPDGCEIARSRGEYWQANARGVDLNHNFDAGWNELHELELASGITAPCATRYGGAHPFSEPETIAIKSLVERLDPCAVYCIHSQGEEIFYSYGENTPSESRLMADMLAQKCGYKVCAPEGLAVGGGCKDWFVEKYARPGFTIEIGQGVNPLPLGDLDNIFEKLWDALYLSVML